MKNLKIFILLVFLLIIYTFICAISYVEATSDEISNSVFRLHVIANSDSDEDQNLKYIVRNALLNYMSSLTQNCSSKEEVIKIAKEHSEEFKNLALETIHNEGYNYNVNIEIGNFEFPTKTYGDISLPSGNYDALKVELGEAKGQNWWCVMFPPLCFIDISSGIVPEESKEYLKNNMSDEDFALISNQENNTLQFKFKLLELFASNGLTEKLSTSKLLSQP